MGTVYLGRRDGPAGFQRLVGLKVMRPHLAGDRMFIDMFLEEARISARLRHPNVVSTNEAFFHDGAVVLVMDYVRGESLMSILRRLGEHGRPLPIDVAIYVVASICDGLAVIHEQGFVHCDISPENILIDEHGISKLSDFGVATAVRKIPEEGPRLRKGKICYMAPEQIDAGEVDARSDIFALGIVLWEATVGRRLFTRRQDSESAAPSRTGAIDSPSLIVPDYPRELEEILLKALHEDVAQRFVSARDFARALRDFARKSNAELDTAGARHAIDSLPRDPSEPLPSESFVYSVATEADPPGFDPRFMVEPAIVEAASPVEQVVEQAAPELERVIAHADPRADPPILGHQAPRPVSLAARGNLDALDANEDPTLWPGASRIDVVRSQRTLARNIVLLLVAFLIVAAFPIIRQRLFTPPRTVVNVHLDQAKPVEARTTHREPGWKGRALQSPTGAVNRARMTPSFRSALQPRSRDARLDLYGPADL
jgi:serine/threonine-protein kinase